MPFTAKIIRNLNQIALGLAATCLLSSCAELRDPEPNPYLAETQPPAIQEFRWSNGGTPKSLDPARASTAPETDVVRAIYEGLTEVDPKTLEAVPAVAEAWSVSVDGKTWSFILREDAKWSNGKRVTANDFVRSWNRLLELGEVTAHRHLLANFSVAPGKEQESSEAEDFVEPEEMSVPDQQDGSDPKSASPSSKSVTDNRLVLLDVSALDDRALIIKLKRPDRDLPKLLAHPIFRPVFGNGEALNKKQLNPKIVTNGAFRITAIDENGISLERSDTYWNRENINLDRVSFVHTARADEALEAYRTGKVDAVTNADFAPLAQKVFSSYADIRRNDFAALNFYEVNYKKPPFNDRRVREALAISIERERLLSGELEGVAKPAFSFLPFALTTKNKLVQDKDRARDLLEQAGFDGGRGFPVIRLVVNRNENQQRMARTISKMWKDNLNIDTEIVVRESSEIPETRLRMDFDVLRRGVVLPVVDEAVSMSAILGDAFAQEAGETSVSRPKLGEDSNSFVRPSENTNQNSNANSSVQGLPNAPVQPVLTQDAALYELRAIPLYFPTSFALVKPYVDGFEISSLDAPLLNGVSINSNWQPKRQ
jgi:oligopeptide transport system substrate-binding protein